MTTSTTTTTTTDRSAAPAADTWRTSLRRTTLLGRVNWTLMLRNRTTMLYALLMPVLPLVLLVVGTRGGENAQVDPSAGILATTLVMALVFPGYYNVLSMFVTRRDELVLKRLRTGEIRDGELLTSMALPGAVLTVVVTLLAVVVAAVLGLDLPRDPLMLLVTVAVAIAVFALFAFWTATWTRTAESAQLTSGPIIALAFVGFARPMLPESLQGYADLTPGGAIDVLVRAAWFGQEGQGGELGLSFLDAWAHAAPSLAALVAWAVLAYVLMRRSLTWEPRA